MALMHVTRGLRIPDEVRLQRYQNSPEFGPSVLFFSGGSALNKISRQLKRYTHNSIHLVTPFDSGGSSAHLRNAFSMPAVGDLRSRIMALADETVLGQPDVYHLFSYRLDSNATSTILHGELQALVDGQHRLIVPIAAPLRTLIQTQLRVVQAALPDRFDLRGASVGNLIIAGGFLNNDRRLDPIVFLFSRLVKMLGHVATIVDGQAHLAVRLQNDDVVIGQHRLTGKEVPKLTSPIKDIWLNEHDISLQRSTLTLPPDRAELIAQADIICFPPGSFFSSVVANLLVSGVAEAIKRNPNPKAYLPNLGDDPEQLGWPLMDRVSFLLRLLLQDVEAKNCQTPVLEWLLLDTGSEYGQVDEELLSRWGIQVVKTKLLRNSHYYDEVLVSEALLSFV